MAVYGTHHTGSDTPVLRSCCTQHDEVHAHAVSTDGDHLPLVASGRWLQHSHKVHAMHPAGNIQQCQAFIPQPEVVVGVAQVFKPLIPYRSASCVQAQPVDLVG
jgi:hypothetical protein